MSRRTQPPSRARSPRSPSSAPAAAHGPTATQAGYVSNVNAVLPNVLGLSAYVVGGDVWLRLSNYSGKEVVILGYQGEPYLRFENEAIYQNVHSPAAYLNRFRGLRAIVPATREREGRAGVGAGRRGRDATGGATTASTGRAASRRPA